MTGITVEQLWEKYLQGTATMAELEQLKWYFGQPAYRAVFDGLLQEAFTDPRHIETADYNVEEIVNSLVMKIEAENSTAPVLRRMPVSRRIWVAASLVLVAIAGAWLWISNSKNNHPKVAAIAVKQDVPPGGEGAMLTLSDGRQVVLDSLRNGLIAHQNGSDIVLENGQLVYDAKDAARYSAVYNTMSTPRGRQFQLILPDGSKVWLNAASSIRFPVAFTTTERKVDITGEVYIEVKKDIASPFIVHGKDFELKVLGTNFNINAYPDNGTVRTTLMDGAVSIIPVSGNNAMRLKPGEQWVYNGKGIPEIRKADMDHVLAWKQKRFSFNGNIRNILQEVARWYDVELQYEGVVPDRELEGGFTREKDLQEVLEILKVAAGVQFELKGKLLIVSASK